jgi:hypothetical protein
MSTHRATHPQDLTDYTYGWDVERQKFFLSVDNPQTSVGEENPRVWFMDELDQLVERARDEALILPEPAQIQLGKDKDANV